MPDSATAATPDTAPSDTKKLSISLPKPGSFGYFLFAQEGSGAMLFFFLFAVQLTKWEPATALGVYIAWFIGAAVLVWYNAAQRNALRIAADESKGDDDKQIARDTGWSSLPNYALWIMGILTVVGLALTYFTSVFDDPGTHWFRDRLIVSWPFAGYLVLVAVVLRGDQTRNSELLAKMKRLMQRFRRDEH
jgi:hypothetical protein